MIHDTIPHLRLLAVINDLHFIQRSGRVRWVDALLGSLLSIKPLVMLKDGQVMLLEKVRTKAKALERLVATTVALGPLQEVAALHAGAPHEAEQVANMLTAVQDTYAKRGEEKVAYPRMRILMAEAGTVMTTHAGPGAVALACVLAKK